MGSQPPGGFIPPPAYQPPVSGPGGGSLIRFLTRNVPPPSRVYITPDDFLQIDAVNLITLNTLLLQFRILKTDGQVAYSALQFQLAASNLVQSFQANLIEGFLLSVGVSVTNFGATQIPIAAQVSISRGKAGVAIPYDVLIRGTLRGAELLAWPQAGLTRPTDGQGRAIGIGFPAPALGAEVLIAYTLGTVVRVQSVLFSLTTSAAIGNRTVSLVSPDTLNRAFGVQSQVGQPQSTTQLYVASAAPDFTSLTSKYVALPIPPNFLVLGGDAFQTETAGLQAGDQYSTVQTLVEQWLADF